MRGLLNEIVDAVVNGMNNAGPSASPARSHVSVSSTLSDNTKAAMGYFSATESLNSCASSTQTTPKSSKRGLTFHEPGNTPEGHHSGASWDPHPHTKRHGPNPPNEEDDVAGAGGAGA